jgi:hypothetical protein
MLCTRDQHPKLSAAIAMKLLKLQLYKAIVVHALQLCDLDEGTEGQNLQNELPILRKGEMKTCREILEVPQEELLWVKDLKGTESVCM